MWDRVVAEAPTFFTWPNAWFLAKAFFATFSLSIAGCLIGSLIGLLLTSPGSWRPRIAVAPVRTRHPRACICFACCILPPVSR